MLRRDHSSFSSASLSTRWSFALCFAAAGLGLGCSPQIGDECTVSTNCSTSGDRLCDITQPGGYCTIFNCEPGSCPDDSACISFGTTLAAAPGCATSQGNSPYQRSFCMARCGSDSDCRSGYACLDLSGKADGPSNNLGAVLAENSGSGFVCVVPPLPSAPNASNEVCLGASSGGASSGASASAGASGSGAASNADEAGAGGSSGVGD